MSMILPFRLNETWFGMDLDKVREVDSCGKISLMPNAHIPLAGLMQKNGQIISVWSLYSLVQSSSENVHKCDLCIQVCINEKKIAIPVEEIISVIPVSTGWIPSFKYGLKIYRSLDKKTPQTEQLVQVEKERKSLFYQDTPISGFTVEEI